jgi:hypothetical protein
MTSRALVLASLAAIAATAVIELGLGRLPFGPDGRFGWWEADVWSAAMSQRAADPYSLSHVLHGLIFYALLHVFGRRLPLARRAFMAVLLECGWEVLENSPIIIERYREVTMALGYTGDSVLNSISDVVMMAIGFFLAARLPVWASIAVLVGLELGMLLTIRDNLVLNIIMLLYPLEAIRTWQMAERP